MLLNEVVARGDHSNRAVALPYVALQTEHADVGVLVEKLFVAANDCRVQTSSLEARRQRAPIVGAEIARAVIARRHQAERSLALFA